MKTKTKCKYCNQYLKSIKYLNTEIENGICYKCHHINIDIIIDMIKALKQYNESFKNMAKEWEEAINKK